ncbi:MAG TPA: TRAP transporter substrate-binding protein [Clostridia bacterium]|nr:TRAP transporter substrate-binding protein [Clostridia bacterium]
MKRNRILALALVLLLAFTVLAGCAKESGGDAGGGEEAVKPIVMKLANGSALGDSRDLSLVKFAELVNEKSEGRVEVEVYSGGTLGAWRDTIEGLEPGIVQIVGESIGTLEPYSELAAIDAYPFLYRDEAHYEKVMNGEIGQDLLKTVGDQGGFVLLGPSYRGARVMTTTKKIEKAEDLEGLKLRAPGLKMYMKTWEYLGASPTPMDPSEIYTGIQQGTVQGQENPVLYCYSNAFYEVCDYLIRTNHVYSTDVIIFNKDYFESLDADIQEILRDAAAEAGQYRTQMVKDSEDEYLAKFEEEGVEVVYPEMDGFYERMEDFGTEFPNLQELVKKIQAVK